MTCNDTESGPAAGDPTERGRYQQRHHEIMSDPGVSPETKRQQLLEVGTERLGVENAHVVKVDRQADRHEVVAATGSDIVRPGTVASLEETFCRDTVTSEAVLAIHDVDEERPSDPAATVWDVGCYVGTRIVVGDEVYGTVCFVDGGSRENQLTPEERAFVDLLGTSIGRLMERERSEEILRRKKERFQPFVNEVTDYAIFMLDPAGYVVSWNKGAHELKGYTESEIIGEHFSRFYPESDRGRGLPEELLQRARRDGQVRQEDWRLRKDGTRFWALVSITALHDEDGQLRGFGKVTRDLTERRDAKQTLEDEQRFISRALNTLDDLFFLLTPDGNIDRVNEQVSTVTGYPREELTSMDPTEFFVSDDRETIVGAVAEMLETGEATVEATLLTSDNKRRQYEFRGTRLVGENGSVDGVVVIGRDITEQALFEERLDVAQRVLRHNIRNDLTVIRGWAEVLEETATGTQQEAVDQILSTVEEIAELSEKTRQMADLDLPAVDEQAVIDVTDRLRGTIEESRQTYPDATIEYDGPGADELWLVADKRFDVAIENAVENAVEHNPSEEPWVRVAVECDAGELTVRVHDDGPGIPEMETNVIERGEETPLQHGLGVGLWLTNWCVTTIGGEITFEERTPRGSTVTLRFPTASESATHR